MRLMKESYSNTRAKGKNVKRIFIAIKVEPGDILAETMESLQSGFPADSIRWTDKDNIHITLAFLGDTSEEKIPGLVSMLKSVCSSTGSFDLTIRSAGLFRDINDPRILWIGTDRAENLIRLNSLIISGLEKTGFPVEKRPFSPHITIGRLRRNANNDKEMLSAFLNKYHDIVFRIMKVSEVILYESVLLRTGPVYHPLSIFPLSG